VNHYAELNVVVDVTAWRHYFHPIFAKETSLGMNTSFRKSVLVGIAGLSLAGSAAGCAPATQSSAGPAATAAPETPSAAAAAYKDGT
jgi:hypothetical protein